ncbi:MAG: nitrilase-related carbon-nitrogen hydrolase [Candidatus Phlomobacter fragariae]
MVRLTCCINPSGLSILSKFLVLGSEQEKRIALATKENNIWLLLGLSERDHGTLYMTQWLISNTGETVGVKWKLKPTHVGVLYLVKVMALR